MISDTLFEDPAGRRNCWPCGLGGILRTVFTVALLAAAGPAPGADEASGWRYSLSPYLWAAGISGRSGSLPGLPPADVDESFGDIWDNLQFAGMVAGVARKGRFAVVGDLQYVETAAKATSLAPFFAREKLTSKTFIGSVLAEYLAAEQGRSQLWVAGGLRLWSVDTELDLATGLLPGRTISGDDTWVDPLIGVRGNLGLGDSKFFLAGWGYIGGFGIGSQIMADVFGGVGYRFSENFSTTLGYRWMKVDRDEKNFLYDVTQDGIMAGMTFRF